MARIQYKRLFEVQILHDYFLSKPDGSSIYELTNAQKAAFLNKAVSLDQYNVAQYLMIHPSEMTKQLFKNYHLKIAVRSTGFIVGIEVKSKSLATGEELYFPFIDGVAGLNLGFHLKLLRHELKNSTNSRLQLPAPYHYYFNNQNQDGLKNFPSLSQPVANFQSGTTYETSELAVVGGTLSQALVETNNANPTEWQTIGGIGLVNEQDRVLLGKQFTYQLPTFVTNAEATLKDLAGIEIKKITYTHTDPFQKLALDFRSKDSQTGETPDDILDGNYRLEVRADGSLVHNKVVKLSSDLYHRTDLGAIEIILNESDPNFKLFNADGSIITKKNADNSVVLHPIFEIRFKCRSTYWRYLSASGKNLGTTPKSAGFLTADGGRLRTRSLKPLTQYPIEFQSDDTATPAINERVFLPNPHPNGIKKEDSRLYSDIYISPIKDLIIES